MQLLVTENCCLCNRTFDESNLPRMMQSCDHSVCSCCLGVLFKNGIKMIECAYCGGKQEIGEADMEYFPKNISLIKMMKDACERTSQTVLQITIPNKVSPIDYLPSFQNKKLQSYTSFNSVQTGSTLTSQVHSQNSYSSQYDHNHNNENKNQSICLTHQKDMEIICLTDFTRICPLCAVFGTHRDHELKTIDETQKILQNTQKQFQQQKQKKKSLESEIKNSQFKSFIKQKIVTKKNLLAKQIRQKFTEIRQVVAIAERKANDELTKCFREVSEKINKIAKEESQFEISWKNWSRIMQLQLSETLKVNVEFQQKVQMHFNVLIDSMKQGQYYLAQLESYINEKKHKLQAIPEMVAIQTTHKLTNEIGSFVSIVFDENCRAISDFQMNKQKTFLRTEIDQMEKEIELTYSKQKTISFNPPTSMQLMKQNSSDLMTKKPIKVEFSSSQNFLSPDAKKVIFPKSGSHLDIIQKRKQSRQKSGSLRRLPQNQSSKQLTSPYKRQPPSSTINISQQLRRQLQNTTQGIVQLFIRDDKLQTLDLCSFQMPDNQIMLLLEYVFKRKKIKCLKLSENRLTNEGFMQMLPMLKFTTNLNLGSNWLTQDVLNVMMRNKEKLIQLRIVNLANNKINQRKAKVYVQQLKRQGIIVKL